MKKKLLSTITAAMLIFTLSSVLPDGLFNNFTVSAASVTDYSYEVTPLLAPFNNFFFVKTDNPDPCSFSFEDLSSKYAQVSDEENVKYFCGISATSYVFEDIEYESITAGRVNGGYIFSGINTDGGDLYLVDNYHDRIGHTNVKVTVPKCKDAPDYLIDRYKSKSGDFFETLDNIQKAKDQISLYSPSAALGDFSDNINERIKYAFIYWIGYHDYMFSFETPYHYENGGNLLSSMLYPIYGTSITWPSQMVTIAQRLNSSAEYKWDDFYHYIVGITLNGKTKTYGGASSYPGMQVKKEDIKILDLNKDLTLENLYKINVAYAGSPNYTAELKNKYDFTSEQLNECIKDNVWARVRPSGYTYIYKPCEDADAVILPHYSNVWVDGRYISNNGFEKGTKYSEHPHANILLTDVRMPIITYDFDWDNNKYIVKNITYKNMNMLYSYNGDSKVWIADYQSIHGGKYDPVVFGRSDQAAIIEMVKQKVLDKKYLDMITLTQEQVNKLNLDKNTDKYPETGIIFDGTEPPGTPFKRTSITSSDVSITLSSNEVIVYSGINVVWPKITVMHGNKELADSYDYEANIDYDAFNDKKPKTTLTVNGLEEGSYYGKKTFTINVKYLDKEPETEPEYVTPVTRLAGSNRFKTAAEISKAEFTTAKTVILANGMNYADALAGVPLAKKLDAPILLTNTKALDTATADEIKRLKAEKVIILGGEGAISADVEQALQKMGLTTERIAGKTRFGTATAIAEKLNSEPTEIIFVYGLNYADALSVSPVAALKNAPIIYLTQDGELNADTAAYLEKIKGKVKNVYVIGGEGVISNDMMNKAVSALGLKTAARIWGANRYSTCIEVNKAFASALTGKTMCVATGLNFPDALAGGVLAAKKAAPLFLTANSLSDEQNAYLKAKALNCIYVFGGTGAVSENIVDKISRVAA